MCITSPSGPQQQALCSARLLLLLTDVPLLLPGGGGSWDVRSAQHGVESATLTAGIAPGLEKEQKFLYHPAETWVSAPYKRESHQPDTVSLSFIYRMKIVQEWHQNVIFWDLLCEMKGFTHKNVTGQTLHTVSAVPPDIDNEFSMDLEIQDKAKVGWDGEISGTYFTELAGHFSLLSSSFEIIFNTAEERPREEWLRRLPHEVFQAWRSSVPCTPGCSRSISGWTWSSTWLRSRPRH